MKRMWWLVAAGAVLMAGCGKKQTLPPLAILTKDEKTTDIPGSQDAMNAILTQNAGVKHWLVYSMNDEGVLGAVRSLEAHGFAADTCAGIGIGGSSCFPELERQEPTSFIGTVLISPKRHGYETTEMLFKWVKDGTMPPVKTLTKGILVDRGNFKEIATQEGVMDAAPAAAGAGEAGSKAKAAPAVDKAGKPIKLGFLVKQPEEKWFQDEQKFATKCAADNGFEIINLGDKDGTKILQIIDTIAAQGAQGFVICTPDTKLGPAIMAKAKEHNMKVFSVDDQFIGSDGQPMEDVPYMGISAGDIGKTVGEALAAECKKRGWNPSETAAAGITHNELATAKARTDGAMEALMAAGFQAEAGKGTAH